MVGMRRIMMGALLVSMVAMPGSAGADPRQVFLGAPYDEAAASANCLDVLALTGSCVTADAAADAETGIFDMELRLRTRDEGESVGLVTGSTVASFASATTRTTPTQAVLGAASLAFDELLVEQSGLLPVTVPFQVWVELRLQHASCPECFGHARKVLYAGDFEAPASASLLAVMARPDGEPIPAGIVKAHLDIRIDGVLVGVGEIHASVLGALQHFEIATPSLERVLGAPYGGAQSARGCGGSVGTTFTCRSAVARSTGRLEMDLDVISPVAGTAPGSGNANGSAWITVDDTPSEPVRARVYLIELVVDAAETFVHDATPVAGSAEAVLTSNVNVTGPGLCEDCTSGAGAGIANAEFGPPSRLDDVLRMGIYSREHEDVAAGAEQTVTVTVDGISMLQNSAGISSAMLRSRLARVRVFEIA